MEICTELVQLGTYLRGGWAPIKQVCRELVHIFERWVGTNKKVCRELVQIFETWVGRDKKSVYRVGALWTTNLRGDHG